MCDCGKFECPFCTNLLGLWVKWSEYVELLRAKHKPHTRDELDQRLGQVLFNTLDYFRPDITDKIRGSLIDPFHNDDMIDVFLDRVDVLWMV